LLSEESIDLMGSIVANVNNLLLIGIFLLRIYKLNKVEYWLGILFILTLIPLTVMFINAFQTDRSILYFFQLILMMSFIIAELFLDYILKIEFRKNRAFVIPYVTLFYASLGGMIGIAGHGGSVWSMATIITFLLMTTFSLIMHHKTGD